MVREGSAGLQDLVPRHVFQLDVNLVRVGNPLVIKTEIKIDADAGAIYLRDPRRYERLARQPAPLVLLRQAPLDIFAEREGAAPRDGRFERLRDDVVVHQEVADIGNAVGQLVTTPAVFVAGFHPAVTRCDAIDVALLLLDLRSRSFKDERACHHLGGYESLDLGYEKPLRFAFQIGKAAAGLGFQGEAELELQIVYKPYAGWWRRFARKLVHELESVFEAREKHRSVFLRLRQWKYFEDGRSDDAERAFRSEHQTPEVQADGFRGEALVRWSAPAAVATLTS